VLAPEKTALIIEDRFAGVNLFAAAFSFDHRIDKAFKFFTRPAINAEPMRKAIRSAVFPTQILHLSRHVGIAPIIKGQQAARNASVVTIPLCQNTCGIAELYSCAAILCAILLKDRDVRPAVSMYQGSVLASPSRTPYTGEKPSNSEIFVMSA
jgi:hypothetical protein